MKSNKIKQQSKIILNSNKLQKIYRQLQNYQMKCNLNKIQFLDCLGYYDFGAEVLNLICVVVVLIKCIINIIALYKEKSQDEEVETQYNKSIKRRFAMNMIIFAFLLSLIITINLSIGIFFGYTVDTSYIQDSTINGWYKFTQIVMICLLNCTNLTVGYLYWKAIRGYYTISEDENQTPLFFGKTSKIIFYLNYLLNLLAIIAYFIYNIINENQEFSKMFIIIVCGIIFLLVLFSTSLCVICRIYFDIVILKSLNLSIAARKKQKLDTIVIIICSLFRIIITLLTSIMVYFEKEDPFEFIRIWDDQSCLDTGPYHGIFLFFSNFIIDLLPAFTFCQMFAIAKQDSKKDLKTPIHQGTSSLEFV